MHPLTLSVNSADGQKHPASLLESHFGMESHVLRHLGTTLGQGAVTAGGLGTIAVVVLIGVVIGVCEWPNRDEVQLVVGSVGTGVDEVLLVLGSVGTGVDEVQLVLGYVGTGVDEVQLVLDSVGTGVDEVQLVLGSVGTGVDEQVVLDSVVGVVRAAEELGQLVAVDAHLVTVISSVVQAVEVVRWCQEWLRVGASGTEEVQWEGGKEAVDFGGSE